MLLRPIPSSLADYHIEAVAYTKVSLATELFVTANTVERARASLKVQRLLTTRVQRKGDNNELSCAFHLANELLQRGAALEQNLADSHERARQYLSRAATSAGASVQATIQSAAMKKTAFHIRNEAPSVTNVSEIAQEKSSRTALSNGSYGALVGNSNCNWLLWLAST